jgi:hypothetical protein
MVWRLGLRGLEWGWRWDGSEATGGATGEEEGVQCGGGVCQGRSLMRDKVA